MPEMPEVTAANAVRDTHSEADRRRRNRAGVAQTGPERDVPGNRHTLHGAGARRGRGPFEIPVPGSARVLRGRGTRGSSGRVEAVDREIPDVPGSAPGTTHGFDQIMAQRHLDAGTRDEKVRPAQRVEPAGAGNPIFAESRPGQARMLSVVVVEIGGRVEAMQTSAGKAVASVSRICWRDILPKRSGSTLPPYLA